VRRYQKSETKYCQRVLIGLYLSQIWRDLAKPTEDLCCNYTFDHPPSVVDSFLVDEDPRVQAGLMAYDLRTIKTFRANWTEPNCKSGHWVWKIRKFRPI